jgi:hypothetical protein
LHSQKLHDLGRDDPQTYADGVLAYAEAEATFDALIEKAKHHLIDGRELAEVDVFRAPLQVAVGLRESFSRLVRDRLPIDAAH